VLLLYLLLYFLVVTLLQVGMVCFRNACWHANFQYHGETPPDWFRRINKKTKRSKLVHHAAHIPCCFWSSQTSVNTMGWVGLIHHAALPIDYVYILVGGFNHLEKIVNGKDAIPYIVGNIRCSKPPTSIYIYNITYTQRNRPVIRLIIVYRPPWPDMNRYSWLLYPHFPNNMAILKKYVESKHGKNQTLWNKKHVVSLNFVFPSYVDMVRWCNSQEFPTLTC
jgi:hypothetical protein